MKHNVYKGGGYIIAKGILCEILIYVESVVVKMRVL